VRDPIYANRKEGFYPVFINYDYGRFDMPIQIFFNRTSPENSPVFNEKSRKATMELFSKRAALLKKHGIKELGSWAVPAEHLIIIVDEAPSLDDFQKLMMEPEFAACFAFMTSKTKAAYSMEEWMKMLK
jgi:hypothetical protein